MKKRILALALVLMLLASILVPVPSQVSAAADRDIQDGVTLHCWNWSFNNIEANMAKIAALGYTAVQTSPIQQAKQKTAGYPMSDWWVYYQPAAFCIDNTGNSALGTKAEFKSMCETAHKYGVKVIVDVVANHMGDNGGNNKSSAIIADIRNDSSCWHDISKNINNYHNRYDITQYCMGGLPDLNTSSDKIQNYVLNFLKECIDCGADGFRFDAAKHIETPDDPYCGSDFWPTVINGAKQYASSKRGIDLYCYGELLFHPDDANSMPDSIYTKYMSVTDNSWSNYVRNSVVGGKNAGAFSYSYHKGASASELVLWAESHDNYAGDGSKNMSVQDINKTWALAAARADAMSLYLARPENMYPQKLGAASDTGWAYAEVGAVNKFHNAFVGKSEYVSNQSGIAYVERGNSGVVLVNCNGTSASVNVTANVMKDGTYKDQITGNTFTVSGGRIKGKIGSTGIAVVYNVNSCTHPSHGTDGNCNKCYEAVGHKYASDGKCVCGAVKPMEKIIYFTNSSNWSKVNIYSWYSGGGEITSSWPGNGMKNVEGNIFSYALPADATNVIFSNGSQQTDDLQIPAGKNMYDYASGKWSVYTSKPTETPTTPTTPTTPPPDTTPATSPTEPAPGLQAEYYLFGYINGADLSELDGNYKFQNGALTVTFTQDSYVGIHAADDRWYMTDGWQDKVDTVVLYNTVNLGENADKMFVPGGLEVTFILEDNGDDSLTLSYSAETAPTDEPTEPSVEPTEPSVDPTEPDGEPTEPNTKPTEDDSDVQEPDAQPSSIGWIVTAVVLVVLLAGGVVLFLIRRKK